jgi:hypothetical protein
MSVLAAAASTSAVLVATTALARADDWQEYLRDDLGFRIEMPGEPEVDVKEEGLDDKIVRLIDAQIYDDEDDNLFGVHCSEYRDPVSAEHEYRLFREGMRLGGLTVTRESALMINNIVAREFTRESDGINFVHRLLVVDRRTIGISVYGDRSIHDSREVQRFLRSFMLLGEREPCSLVADGAQATSDLISFAFKVFPDVACAPSRLPHLISPHRDGGRPSGELLPAASAAARCANSETFLTRSSAGSRR